MMEIQVGDVFRDLQYIDYMELFEVVEIVDRNLVDCQVYLLGHCVRRSFKYKETLLKMQKLSSLEKELM